MSHPVTDAGATTATKRCPFCAEEILMEAVKCKHCGSWLDRPSVPRTSSSKAYGTVRSTDAGLKVFWILSIVAGYLLGNLLLGVGLFTIDEDGGPIALLLGLVFLLYAVSIQCVVLHRMWKAIQGSPVRTTPGRAVGFLFIPFFNFYWIFQAFWGWAVDFNRSAREHGLNLPRAPEGLALTIGILALASIIPFAGLVSALAYCILLGIFFAQAINCVNALATQVPPGAAMPKAADVGRPKKISAARPVLQIVFAVAFYSLAMLSVTFGAFYYFEGWRGSEDTIALFVTGCVLGLCGAALQLWFLRNRGKGWPLAMGTIFGVLAVIVIAGSWIGRAIVVRDSRAFRAAAETSAQSANRELAAVMRGMVPSDSSRDAELRAILDRVLAGCPEGSTRGLLAVVLVPVEGQRDRLWKGPPFKQIEVGRSFEGAVVEALANEPQALSDSNDPDFVGEEANYFWLHVITDADNRPLAVARLGAVRASTSAFNDFRR